MMEEEKKELENPIQSKEELPDPLTSRPEVAPPKEEAVRKKTPWLLIAGGLAIVLLLAVFAYLLVASRSSVFEAVPSPSTRSEEPREPAAAPVEETDAATAALERQSTSDEVAEIERDINATDFSNLEQELEDIEAELSTL